MILLWFILIFLTHQWRWEGLLEFQWCCYHFFYHLCKMGQLESTGILLQAIQEKPLLVQRSKEGWFREWQARDLKTFFHLVTPFYLSVSDLWDPALLTIFYSFILFYPPPNFFFNGWVYRSGLRISLKEMSGTMAGQVRWNALYFNEVLQNWVG